MNCNQFGDFGKLDGLNVSYGFNYLNLLDELDVLD